MADERAEPSIAEQDEWLRQACAAIGVDHALLDVGLVLELTKQVAHGFVRPMAPVSAYALGIAVGLRTAAGADADQAELVRQITETLPPQQN